MRPKLIYRAFSLFEFVWTLLLRVACVAAVIIAWSHYEENPVVISVFIGICLLLILFLGDDEISVYTDRIVQSTNSSGAVLFRRKGTVIKLSDIKRAFVPDNKPTLVETGIIMALLAVLPKNNSSSRSTPIFLSWRVVRPRCLIQHWELAKLRK